MGNKFEKELSDAAQTGKLNLSNCNINQISSKLLSKLQFEKLIELELNNNQVFHNSCSSIFVTPQI